MYFNYGSKQFPDNQVTLFNVSKRRVLTSRGFAQYQQVNWDVYGEVIKSTQADFKSEIAAVEAAFLVDQQDAILYHDDDTESGHVLRNSDSMNGVTVAHFSWVDGGNPEAYATERHWRAQLQAEFITIENQLATWQESLTFIGNGGPKLQVIETFDGPVSQLIYQRTSQRIIQSGIAVGVEGWPLAPSPMFPNLEHQDQRIITSISPRRYRNTFQDFTVRWRYVFSSPQPQFGRPSSR